MSTTAPDARITTYTPTVATTEFEALFPIFDNSDLAVYVNGQEQSDFTVSASYDQGVANNARVIMATGVTGKVLIIGDRDPRRQNRFGFGPIPPRDLNLAFDTVEGEMQEARRDIERSVRSVPGQPGFILDPNIADGDTLMRQGNRLVAGPNLPELAADMIASAAAEADRARSEANRSDQQANRSRAEADRAAGYVSDAVSQGTVPIYATVAGMPALEIPAGINALRVNGYYAAGDKGGGLAVGDDNGTPAWFTTSGGKTWYRADQQLNIRSFGARADGSNETAIIQAIDSFAPSQPVDMLGATLVSDVWPQSAELYNGALEIGGDRIPLPGLPVTGPFPTPHLTAMPTDFQSWLGGVLYSRGNGVSTVIYPIKNNHFTDATAEVWAFDTYDNGQTLQNHRFAYKLDGYEASPMGGGTVSGGRMVYIAAQRDAASSYIDPVCVYSDDGEVFSSVAIVRGASTPAGWPAVPHGVPMRLPASVGGDDANGWFMAFYGGNQIGIARSIDNCQTWSDIEIVIPALAGAGPTEMAIGKVPGEDKWYMIIRDEITGKGTVSFSTDPVATWSVPVDLPFPLNKGAPYLIEYSDQKHFLYARTARNVQALPGYQSQLLEMEIDPKAFFESAGARGWKGWRVFLNLGTWAVAYPSFAKDGRGGWIGIVNGGERAAGTNTTQGGPSTLSFISNRPSPALSISSMRASIPGIDLAINGDLQVWQLGTEFIGAASRITTADGWGLRRQASVLGHFASRQEFGSKPELRFGRSPGDGQTNTINMVCALDRKDLASVLGRYVTVVIEARFGADYSGLWLYASAQTSPTATAVSTSDGTLLGDAVNVSGNKFLAPVRDGRARKLAFSFLVPADSNLLAVRLYHNPTGVAGADDWVQISRCNIFEGAIEPSHIPLRYGDALERCLERIEKTTPSHTGYPNSVYNGGNLEGAASGSNVSTLVINWRLRREKRSTTTYSIWSPATGAGAKLHDITGNVDVAAEVVRADRTGCVIQSTEALVDGHRYRVQAMCRSELW